MIVFQPRNTTKHHRVHTNPNVSPKYLPPSPFVASPTSQASGAENNKLVPIPLITLPNKSTVRRLLFVLAAPRLYKSANASVPRFRPLESHNLPTTGPKKAVDANPVRNNLDTTANDAGMPLKTLEE